ncbi:hypothetical protein [Mesorhizobium sp. CAU 1732]|uniref:hypothetical protein n=1 Tax=Mesorhizobium sp. CAU 1732 TaxID=3140358 RepID=UPI00326170A0
MKAAVALAPLLFVAAQAVASDSWLEGEWCAAGRGERLIIEADEIGFNEHTICAWTDGRPTQDAFDVTVSCANVYPNGDETVRMDGKMVRLEASKAAPETIFVTVEGDEPTHFDRCDG